MFWVIVLLPVTSPPRWWCTHKAICYVVHSWLVVPKGWRFQWCPALLPLTPGVVPLFLTTQYIRLTPVYKILQTKYILISAWKSAIKCCPLKHKPLQIQPSRPVSKHFKQKFQLVIIFLFLSPFKVNCILKKSDFWSIGSGGSRSNSVMNAITLPSCPFPSKKVWFIYVRVIYSSLG